MFGWICLVVFAIITFCHLRSRYSRIGRMIDRLPGPRAYPLIGCIEAVTTNRETLFQNFQFMNKLHYPLYRIWIFNACFVNVCHPNHLEAIMGNSKHIEKSYIYNYLHPWLRTGLLTSTGAKWHKRRKILTPAFHFSILTHFFDIFVDNTHHLVKMLKEEGRGKPVVKDLLELTSYHASNAIYETAMGVSIKEKGNMCAKYKDATKAFSQLVIYRAMKPWYDSDFLYKLSTSGRLQSKLLPQLHDFVENIIAERKRYHESTNRKYLKSFDEIDGTSTVRKKRLPMLDLLISASLENNEIDDEGIREEVHTFILGGHDTIVIAASFALLLFAKHKDVQERLREEVNEVMLENNEKLTASDLQKFSYLERCLKETLRLYPSGHIISRKLNGDCQLGEYTIPSGAMCYLHIYAVHRDPNFWPNPLVFDPDRFLPENVKGRHPYSYIPFSAGLRNCVGQKFAMMEMKLLVAYILYNFALEPECEIDDVQFTVDLVLRPSHPLPVKFIPIR